MQFTSAQHPTIPFLPQAFARPTTEQAASRLDWRHWAILAGVLVPPLVITLYLELVRLTGYRWHEHALHSFVEGFCALMSLVVAYVLYQEYRLSDYRRLLLISFGFLAMGIMDFFHAFSKPGSNLFVWFHSMSAFLGAALLAGSLITAYIPPCREASRKDGKRS